MNVVDLLSSIYNCTIFRSDEKGSYRDFFESTLVMLYWKKDSNEDLSSFQQEVPIVVAGNKLDLAPARREVAIEDVSEWLFRELPKLRAKVMECSAKDDYNIKDVFRCFVTLSRIVPKNPTGEVEQSGLRRRCSAYGSRRYHNINTISCE